MSEGGDRPDPGAGSSRRWRLVRAGRDAVSRQARQYGGRSARGRRRLLARWLAAVAAVLVASLIAWLLYGTALFAVTTVRVHGTGLLTADQVRQAAEVRDGTPLARVDTDEIGRRVARLVPVERVVVERDWPDAVVIRVTERTAVAAVPSARGFLHLDRFGVVFHAEPKRPPRLPLVELSKPGPKDITTRDALRVLEALTDQLRSVLVKLSAPSPTRIKLHLTKGRTVIWGDAEASGKKAEVATVLLKRPVKIIDVSAPKVVTTR